MRIIEINSLKGGEMLAKQIFNEEGRVLLNSGVELSPYLIDRIREMGVQIVYVNDEISNDIIIEESLSERTKQESKHAIKEIVNKYCREGKTDNGAIMKSVDTVIYEIYSNKAVMINVAEIKASDNSIYSHSLNVCVLATIIGTQMGFNMMKLKEIATGAILHDIGKIKIMSDKKLVSELKSKGELDEYIKQNHPKAGFDFLSKENFCSSYTKAGVLMHHERNDGSGYPLKLKGKEIIEIGKLISICDIFSNMVFGSKTEGAKSLNEAVEYLYCMSDIHFDSEIVRKFTANLAAYPNGSGVVLNTKEKGLVIRQNQSLPLRPIIKIIYDRDGNQAKVPYEIDLCKELTLFIEQSFEISL